MDNSGMKQGLSALDNYVTTYAANMTAQITGAVASALSAIPSQIVEIGSQFESSMSQVAATMGITSAAAEFTQLSAAAKEMGETTKFSASQAADALNYLALAGYDAEKSVAALPTVLNLAAAGGIELAEASDMVTDSMSALGLSMDELESFADKMAKTSQKSNTSVAQLGQSILSVGANAQILAGGTTELMTELGILADSGLKSAEAGTALARVIKNLSTPTSVAAEELENLGVKCYDSEGNFRNMQDIFADLQDAMDGFTAEQVQESMSQIFDTAALSSAKVLLSQCGDRFDELSGYIDDADGAAAQMAETMSDNLTGDITICQSALEGLANTAYEKFQGTIRAAVQAVTEDVGTLTESMKDGELSESVDKLAAAFSNAAASAADLLADDVIPAVISGFSLIVEHGNEIISVTLGIGAAFATIKVVEAVTKMSISFKAASVSLAALEAETTAATFQQAALRSGMTLTETVVGLLTGKITLATAAQAAWNAVIAINPMVFLAAALTGAAVAIASYTIKASAATEATKEAGEAVNNAAESLDDLNSRIADNSSATQKNEDELKNKIAIYEELRQQYEKTGEGEEQLKEIMQEIQELSPTTISFIDEETGAYLSLADSIDDVIAAMERKRDMENLDSAWNTAKDNLDDLYEQQQKLKDDEADLYEQLENANVISAGYIHNKLAQNKEQQLAISESILENEKIVLETQNKMKALYTNSSSDGGNIESGIDYSSVGGTIAAEEKRKGEEANKRLQENIEKIAAEQKTATEALAAGWEAADHEYAIGAISSEEELLAAKKALWAEYGNENNKEHWKYQEDIISTENSIAEERRRAAEQAEKELNETVTESEEENAKDVEEILQEKWQNISHLENLGVLTSEEAYQKRKELIGEYCPEYSDEWYDYYKTVYDYEQDFAEKQLEDRKAALKEELSAVKANIDSIISEYKSAYSDIQSNISSYKSQLLSVAENVFSVEETENPDGTKTRTLKVNDIKAQIDKMKKYHELMLEMRDEGASVSLLQEFSKLDPDDGIQMAEYMLSSGDFEQINELYKERDAIAQQLAEDFYSPELEALNSSTTDKILDEYSGLPDEFREIGSAAALNLIIGLNEGISDLSDYFTLNAETFFDTSGLAVDNLSTDDIIISTDTGDMLAKGKSDGELYAEGFEQGMQGISAEVDISSRQASTAAALNENVLASIAQKLIDKMSNITIRNVLTAQLECDGKSLAQIVNAETETKRRVSDAYG